MQKTVPFTDVVEFQEGPGVRNYQYTNEGVKLLNVANFVNGNIDLSTSDRYISKDEAYGRYKHFLVNEGDFIIASSGIQVDYFDKKMGFAKKEHLPLCMNTSTIRFRCIKADVMDIRYFMYYLKSEAFKQQLFRQITGSAQLNFGPSHLKKMHIQLVDMNKQKKIINSLSKLEELISVANLQLAKLDELVKAKFVEMFGDCALTQMKDSWKTISEIGEVVGGSTPNTDNEEYWDGDLRWISPAEINTENVYLYDSKRKITPKGKESCSLRELPIGTVILSSRAPIGKLAIAANTFYCNQGFKNIICTADVLPRYLYTLLLMNTDYLVSIGRGATFKEISKSMVESIKIPVPELTQQEKFTDYVYKVDEIKSNVRKKLDNLETLKKSLMQEYFG